MLRYQRDTISRKSKDRKCNGQNKKNKKTNNDLQDRKLKSEQHECHWQPNVISGAHFFIRNPNRVSESGFRFRVL